MPLPDVDKILKDLELKAVGLDPKTNEMQAGYFCSFRDIGLPIHKDDFGDPWSPLDGGKSEQSYLNAFTLVDDKLRMNGRYSVLPGTSKVSDSWWAIITGATGVPTDSVISDDLTRRYTTYLQYEDQYQDRVKAWHRAHAAACTDPRKLESWPVQGSEYEDDANDARDRWVSFGFKEEVEDAIATLAAQGADPAIALIARAKKHYQNSLNAFPGRSAIPNTMMIPPTWYDPDNDDGWTTYTSSDYHAESRYSASSTSYLGGCGCNIGFWSAGANFEHDQTSLTISADDLEISFSYCIGDIKRPWLDTSLLHLNNWFLTGDSKKGCISDGTFGQQKPAACAESTFLPSIVTSLILVKDLRLEWSNHASDMETFRSITAGGGSVGFGPFCVSGHHSHHNETHDWEYERASRGLTVHGVQVIGYVSMINPSCPGVDSSKYLQPAAADDVGLRQSAARS